MVPFLSFNVLSPILRTTLKITCFALYVFFFFRYSNYCLSKSYFFLRLRQAIIFVLQRTDRTRNLLFYASAVLI